MAVIDRFLERRRPGWLLERIARAPVPIAFADRIAERRPEPAVPPSAIRSRARVAPRPAVAGVLDGDVDHQGSDRRRGLPTGMGLRDRWRPRRATRRLSRASRRPAAGLSARRR